MHLARMEPCHCQSAGSGRRYPSLRPDSACVRDPGGPSKASPNPPQEGGVDWGEGLGFRMDTLNICRVRADNGDRNEGMGRSFPSASVW